MSKIPAKDQDARIQGSTDRFGYSWERFSQPSEDQEKQFNGWTALLKPEDWVGKSFLDCGCGAGRNSLWAMRRGARHGVAIDLDERSLAAAERNLSGLNVEIRRQSLYDVDDRDVFDIVFSIGVVHHLEKPDEALAQMVRAAKPGGKVLVWLYGYENMELYVNLLDPLRKLLLSRLPLSWVWALATLATIPLYVALRLGLGRIAYFKLIRRFSFAHLRHILFDQMIPRIAKYYRQDEALSLMARAGLDGVDCAWVNQMSWCVVGTKPASQGEADAQ
jgi:SAM-dependent methyltransferase